MSALRWIEPGSPLWFPDHSEALNEPDGLLAAGGDLNPKRLLYAYQNGIFPWYSEDDPILWWSPDPRFGIKAKDFHISKSLKKFARKHNYTVTYNADFERVISLCGSSRNDTWINSEMIAAYLALHHQGFAHSVEVWQNNDLVGGLYGILLGGVFCGESMFSLADNASKIGFSQLAASLFRQGCLFIDCQIESDHLKQFGATNINRTEFLSMLGSSDINTSIGNAK